jgi:hypothetical protein
MATVDKNFRIKNGLVIEGSTATLNGNNILSENTQAGDSYILTLVGGATLVKSVTGNLSVDGSGALSLDQSGLASDMAGSYLYANGDDLNVDIEGIADDLISNADFATNSDITSAVGTAVTNLQAYADQAELDAVATANSYTNGEITTALTTAQGYANTAYSDAVSAASSDATDKANAAQAAAELTSSNALTTAVNNLEAYADQAEVDAKAYTDTRETAITSAYQSYADTAEQDAKNYADDLINDASNLSTEVWSAYKTNTEIGLAQAAAELHADNAIAALVDSAPATLDTLNELAAALQDNPDIISDLQDIAAGKQDTLTAGSNIDITGATISVTGLDAADISDFNTAALAATAAAYDMYGAAAAAQEAAEDYADGLAINYDAAGSASAAQTAAQSYADGLAVNYDAAGSANAAQAAAEGHADGLVDNLVDGTTAFTEINVNDEAKHIAATSASFGSVPVTAYQWAKADFRSGKFLVKIDNGTHNEISEILVTLDSSDNVAITEYAIVGTNGSRGTITASVSGANVQLRVDPVNDSTIKVTGTLLK